MEANDIEIVKTSVRGAAFVKLDGKSFWIKPQAATALLEGRVLPQVVKAFERADEDAEKRKNLRPFQKVRFNFASEITKKALKVETFDGKTHILPISQIQGWNGTFFRDKSDYIYVPEWLVREKGIQAKSDLTWREVD